ncbi:TPA: flagellar export protein FliJ [Vibrio parahaemolyticus]|uniref:flagellar export protein FliJ n=1 Tax=Vibrio parahaemolyticus TaxID=670 RepID=UPI0004159222|nr:flagellar export protein FliJ [Vibrio parahaemolyticus]MDF4763525.1 flagellar export protein FliJ [Vibrio parahaemolyticus]HBC3403991.1 flagellar export protein FliJ [Vibrio parahaemolyticus]HBH7867195.1 flagellar export protein FliJ [Vibrio parahaemolyticus]HBN6092646.1 flagellar export protein FliJ [Vibrio parahaemolyticus]HBN6182690.1 flagellar export protein FliJ [Vibrio parahaemolyticus]
MKAKLKAVGKLQQMEEKQRDRVGQQLDAMRQRHNHLSTQLQQLSALKGHAGQSALSSPSLNSAALMNFNRVDQMLQRMLSHHEQEQAVMQAECASVQKTLEHKHARVQGLEKVLDRWRTKQNYEKAKKEQKLIEDIINSRVKRKTL